MSALGWLAPSDTIQLFFSQSDCTFMLGMAMLVGQHDSRGGGHSCFCSTL